MRGAPVRAPGLERSHTPLTRMARAVTVHTATVDRNTSKMPHIPCRAGWSVRAAPWAMAEVPRPASLVNTPRATP